MKRFFTLLFSGSFLMISMFSCITQEEKAGPWPTETRESRPWSRWWWLGSEVDSRNITSLMELYSEAGFGGLEITPLYGVKGHEQNYLNFLSPEWMDMLELSIAEAERLEMGIDMNLGTGWPFGGPQITPQQAAGKLILESYQIYSGQNLDEKIMPRSKKGAGEGVLLEALMAYSDDGRIINLTSLVDEEGRLDWTPKAGNWELVAAFCGKTGQKVKRAAPGGEGFTMDHFSTEALNAYLDGFDEAFIGREKPRSFFNDSYEVYNASWTPGLFEAFLDRRGYDLRHHLAVFSGSADPELSARVKSDYRQTLSELLLENFTQPWTAWSNNKGSLTRNQAHGSPGNLIDLYAAVDIPECEIYGHGKFDIPGMRVNTDDSRNVAPNPMMLKLATSAAHVTNKPLISNETFTWLGEHFKVALSQCKPEVEEAFLAGINHVFYHGISYSPLSAQWPGWLFYASVNFGPTSTFWSHLPSMNKYITRCQSILQSGTSDNEVLVYWPIYDIWNDPEGMEMQLSVHNIREWLHYPEIERMAEQGYSYDFISDNLLQEVESHEGTLATVQGSVKYKVLVVPACELMPLETLEKILDLAQQGALVVFEELPQDVPGFNGLRERRAKQKELLEQLPLEDAGQEILKCKYGEGIILKSADLGKALEYAGISRERISDLGLKFIRRKMEDGKFYYLVNHGPDNIDAMLPLNTPATSVLIMDPQDGSYGSAIMESGGIRTRARIQIPAGESLFIRTYDSTVFHTEKWRYEKKRLEAIELEGSWKLSFLSGGPQIPDARSLETLKPWTALGDSLLMTFSGTAEYSLKFMKPDIRADRFLLDLGSVHESARVLLNGEDLGVVWSLPAEIDLGKSLREGENLLRIQVANLMANRIIDMDRRDSPWRNFHEINFVDITYKPFNASNWEPETSGLTGPVRLIPIELH